jgi:hypothetical protein
MLNLLAGKRILHVAVWKSVDSLVATELLMHALI